MNRILFSILLVMVVLPTLFFSQSNESKIQGTWRLEGKNRKNVWFLEWTFEGGKFTQTGYPPLLQKGKYKIIEEKGVQFKLELFDQDGTFGKENKQILVLIDSKRKELTIDRKTGFKQKAKDANTQTASDFLKNFGFTIDESIPVTLIDIEFPKAFTSLPWYHYQSASATSGLDLTPLMGSFAKIHKYQLKEKNKTKQGEFIRFAYLTFQQNKLVGAWWSDSSSAAPNINAFRK